MAKLYITEVPTKDALQQSVEQYFPQIDAQALEAYLTFRTLNSEMDILLDEFFSNYGLSAGRFILMSMLRSSKDGMMPSELAQRVGVTQATISGLINNLEKAGLANRQTHQQDGRAFVIRLTEKGTELIDKLSPQFFTRVKTMMSNIDPSQQEQLANISRKLLAKVQTFAN